MSEILQFSNRAEFRNWLMENHDSDQGVWLVFGKKGGPKTIKAGEALEEALCFGWIDGQMNQIDSEKYIKYFKRRQKKSRWSEKNKNIVRNLRTKGLMTEFGEKAVEEAKQNGMWNLPKPVPISPDQVDAFEKIYSRTNWHMKILKPCLRPFNVILPDFILMPKQKTVEKQT